MIKPLGGCPPEFSKPRSTTCVIGETIARISNAKIMLSEQHSRLAKMAKTSGGRLPRATPERMHGAPHSERLRANRLMIRNSLKGCIRWCSHQKSEPQPTTRAREALAVSANSTRRHGNIARGDAYRIQVAQTRGQGQLRQPHCPTTSPPMRPELANTWCKMQMRAECPNTLACSDNWTS